jgi:hypothetical protein
LHWAQFGKHMIHECVYPRSLSKILFVPKTKGNSSGAYWYIPFLLELSLIAFLSPALVLSMLNFYSLIQG